MLSKIFTNLNLKILDLIRKENLHIREIADRIGCSPGKVHKFVQLFKRINLVKEVKKKNKKIIYLNKDNVLLAKIIALDNINRLMNSNSYKKLKKLGKVGLYGSFAKGTDDLNSDIDLWVYTNESTLKLREIVRKLEKELKKPINLLVLNTKKIKTLKEKDPEFYIRLKLTSINLNGDIFD